MLIGVADVAGFEAYYFPLALWTEDIDAGVTEGSGDVAVGSSSLHLGERIDERGVAVKAHLAIGDIESGEVKSAGAEIGESVIFGLQSTGGGDGDVVVCQQRAHSGGIGLEHGGAPGFFKLFDLVAVVAFLDSGLAGVEGACA